MKWTTFLYILVLECSIAQSNVAYLKALAPPSPFTVYTPFDAITSQLDIVNGMPYVYAQHDGKDGRFLLDTGAPMLVLNSSKITGKESIPAANFSSSFNLSATKVKKFQWASVERKHLQALVLEIDHLEESTGSKLEGIIGYDILKDFELFIDYPNEQVLLLHPSENSLHKAAKPMATLDIELQDHLPVITVQIGSKTLRFGLDTGAGVNLIDKDCKTALPLEFFTILGVEEIRAINQTSSQVEAALVNNVHIADLPFDNMKYLLTEFSDLQSKTNLKIDGLMGFPFFERVKCSIDYPNKKLHIWSILP